MRYQRIISWGVVFLVSLVTISLNAQGYNEWPDSDLGNLKPIIGGKYGAPILTYPYPGTGTHIKISREFTAGSLNLEMPVMTDKEGNQYVPIVQGQQLRTYVPLIKDGDPIDMPNGRIIKMPVSETDGILYIGIELENNGNRYLTLPAAKYPGHKNAYVVPFESTPDFEYVIPLLWKVETKGNLKEFNPWPVEHNPLIPVEFYN